jgi:hypothetical protein
VWTGIRSYLKGSIEAVQKGDPLTEVEFLNTTKFGRKRCLLDPEQRSIVYKHFERYEKNRKELELWDDCDRVAATLDRITNLRSLDGVSISRVCYSKIYVDEVQDYTQAEIALFFLLSDRMIYFGWRPGTICRRRSYFPIRGGAVSRIPAVQR